MDKACLYNIRVPKDSKPQMVPPYSYDMVRIKWSQIDVYLPFDQLTRVRNDATLLIKDDGRFNVYELQMINTDTGYDDTVDFFDSEIAGKYYPFGE